MRKQEDIKMAGKRVVSDDQKEEFIKDYHQVGSAAALAEKWSIAYVTALTYLKRFGVELKRGRPMLDEYHPKLGVWIDSRIAKDLGVSQQAVSLARRLRGIESPLARALRIAQEGE